MTDPDRLGSFFIGFNRTDWEEAFEIHFSALSTFLIGFERENWDMWVEDQRDQLASEQAPDIL